MLNQLNLRIIDLQIKEENNTMAEKIEITPEMGKDELVWALNILLCMTDMPKELNKITKAGLFRLFDQFQDRGQNFSVIEDKLRDAERREMALMTDVAVLEKKLAKAQRDLKNVGKPTRRKHAQAQTFKKGFGIEQNTAMANAFNAGGRD